MQHKVVRFTSHNEFYSPTYSPRSSPQPTPPLPDKGSTLPLSIHRLLKFRDDRGFMKDQFHFDLSNNPTTTLPLMSNPLFQQPAMVPPTSCITLACEAFPWEITIHRNGDVALTVADVFQGLHLNLRQPTTDEEYQIETARRQSEVDESLDIRRGRPGEDTNDVRRRVDFLRLQHRFLGLSPTVEPSVWKLHISP